MTEHEQYLHPEYTEYEQYLRKHRYKQNKGAYGSKDSEKTKTYRCEWALNSMLRHQDNLFENINQCQKFVNKIVSSKTWTKVSQKTGRHISTVQMKDVSGGIAGFAEPGGIIRLKPSTGFDKYTIIHELAHQAGNWHHGRSFRKTLLILTSRFLGKHYADALKAEFKKAKLTCGEARKPLSFNKWLKRKNNLTSKRLNNA